MSWKPLDVQINFLSLPTLSSSLQKGVYAGNIQALSTPVNLYKQAERERIEVVRTEGIQREGGKSSMDGKVDSVESPAYFVEKVKGERRRGRRGYKWAEERKRPKEEGKGEHIDITV